MTGVLGDGPTEGLGDGLVAALDRLAQAPALLVALDFDGVLAPIVEEAAAARPLPASVAALGRLVAVDGVHVALVSGRSMASLREVSGPPAGALLVASHGAEGDGVPAELSGDQAALLGRVTDAVADVVAAHPGTELETKPAGAVLHTRRAPREAAAAAAAAVLGGPARWDGVRPLRGKEVVELSVVEADKGSAVRALRSRLAGGGWLPVLFAGDDVTDEHAFAVLDAAAGDVGVKVGPGESAAGHRVGSPQDVSTLLEHLVGALAAQRG